MLLKSLSTMCNEICIVVSLAHPIHVLQFHMKLPSDDVVL